MNKTAARHRKQRRLATKTDYVIGFTIVMCLIVGVGCWGIGYMQGYNSATTRLLPITKKCMQLLPNES